MRPFRLSSSDPTAQSGNMLVYILGAIFLMGLLVMLVRGSSNTGGGIDSENVVIKASQVQQYAGELERAVAIVIRNGHSEADIRFNAPNAPSAYDDPVDNAPESRQVFAGDGGAAEYRSPPPGVNDGTPYQFFATTHIPDLGTNTLGAMRAELVMVLPNVTDAFCERINEQNDQTLTLTDAHDPSGGGCIYDSGSEFVGSFASGTINTLDESFFTHLPPKQACVRCQGGGLHFYHVLMAR